MQLNDHRLIKQVSMYHVDVGHCHQSVSTADKVQAQTNVQQIVHDDERKERERKRAVTDMTASSWPINKCCW